MLIEDAVPPSTLAAAQQAYERTIERAIEVGAAQFDAPSPAEGPYRFQDPHHPAVMETALVEALSGPKLMEFVDRLYGAQQHCMHGIAAFSMGVRHPLFQVQTPIHLVPRCVSLLLVVIPAAT